LPLFPLHTVLFPGGNLPLRIFEQRYMEMAKDCLKRDAPFGVCLIQDGKEVGAPATPHAVGTLARIAAWDMAQLGVLNVVAQGGARFRILERTVQPDGLARARTEAIPDDVDSPVPAEFSACQKLLQRVIEQQPELLAAPHLMDSCAWVGGRLAELLPLPLAMKQELLELGDARERLSRLRALLKPG
jgi:Lon protease-like protein